MRTTLTIADDVAAQLDCVRSARKARLKDVINEALREGLKRMAAAEPPPAPFQTASASLGRCLIGSIDDVADALAVAEGEGFPVILVDANLLVYAHVASLPQHHAARAWLDDKLSGAEPVGFPWPSLLSFVRLVSNPRVFERPEPVAKAWQQAEAWLGCRASWIPVPGERHGEILRPLLLTPGLRSNHVPDAHLAALAIEHDLALCSTDGDFARFPGLRWENPLV